MNTTCKLTDEELMKACTDWVSKLCNTGGNAWCLQVPVNFEKDPDMLFLELVKRLRAKQSKTKQQWEDSGKELGEFLIIGDEVDSELYWYMAGVVAAKYCYDDLLQVGEPDYEKEGVYYYTSFRKVNDRYFYLGVLPEFLQ